MTTENPYEPPRSVIARAHSRLAPTMQLAVHAALGLKVVQLLVSVWFLTRGVVLYASVLDVGLHFGGGALLLAGRRIGLLPVVLAGVFGIFASMRNGQLVPARVIFLVGLPLVILIVALRNWATFSIPLVK